MSNQVEGTSDPTDAPSPVLVQPPLPQPTYQPAPQPPNMNTVLQGMQSLNIGGTQVDPNLIVAIIASLQVAGVGTQVQNQSKATKMKIKEPDEYDGKNRGGDAKRFLLACENYFKARQSDFPDSEAKIQFTLSYLRGTAQAWGDIILRDLLGAQKLAESYSWTAFKKSFIRAFGDPDKEGTAIRKLENLTQGNQPAATYAADFRRIKADINWNEQAFMHAYRQGLRSDVKDGMVYHDKADTLEKLIALTIRIDDRLWERKQEKNGDHNPRPQPRPQPRPPQPPAPPAPISNAPNAFAHSQPVPIHVNAARRGKLTPEERSRRQREGLCFYCGEKGHTAAAHQRPRQAVINYQYQAPQYYTPTIAATQLPPQDTSALSRSNNPFIVSISPMPTSSTGTPQQGFSASTQ